MSLSPLNVQVNGRWERASTTLTDQGGEGLVATRHPLSPRFAEDAASADVFEVSRGGYSLSFALQGARSAKVWHPMVPVPGVPANEAIYRSVLPNADLTYQVAPDGVKEVLLLRKAPSKGEAAFSWTVEAPGLTAQRTASNEVEFRDSAGAVVFVMPAPIMWDSSPGGAGGPAVAEVAFDLVAQGPSGYVLTLRPDVAWLQDAARVYPVSVDPSVVLGYVRSIKSDSATASYAQVGNPQQGSLLRHWRTIERWNYSAYSEYQIVAATLSAARTNGTSTSYTGGVYVATGDCYSCAGTSLASLTITTSGSTSDEAIYQQLQNWNNAGQTGGLLMLTGKEYSSASTQKYSWKALSTSLTITYVAKPTVDDVTASSPQDGDVTTTTPVFQAIGTEQTGTGQVFQYVFTSSDGGASYTSAWVPTGPYRVPDGVLTEGKHYTYVIWTKSNYPASPTVPGVNPTHYWFVVDTAPAIPSDIRVDGQPLTANVASTEARPIVSAAVTDPDGGTVGAIFTVKTTGPKPVVVVDSLAGSMVASGDTSSVRLPYGLSPGVSYTIEVRTTDGHLMSTVVIPAFSFTGPGLTAPDEIPTTWDAQTGAM